MASADVEGVKLALHRRFDNPDLPYVLEVGGLPWALAFAEDERFTHAARCGVYPPGKHHKDGARFRHEASGADGRVFFIELGVSAGEGVEPDVIYFSFDGKRVSGVIGEPGELTHLLATFAEDVAFLRQTGFHGGGGRRVAGAGRGPQQAQIVR